MDEIATNDLIDELMSRFDCAVFAAYDEPKTMAVYIGNALQALGLAEVLKDHILVDSDDGEA
jgi:hypothetical protein